MAYDGMYGELSTRGAVNETLNLAIATKDECEELLAQVQSYALKAAYTFTRQSPTSAYLVDPDVATVHHLTLSRANVAINCAFPTDPDLGRQVTLILKQGAGSNLVTWDPKIKWAGDMPPVLSYDINREDVVTILFLGDDTKAYGFFNGASFA